MSDLDRFVEFLRSAAAGYNAPPPTPREEIWARVDEAIGMGGAVGMDGAIEMSDDDREEQPDRFVEFLRRTAAGYNAPPPTPRDEMWNVIHSTLEGANEIAPDETAPEGTAPDETISNETVLAGSSSSFVGDAVDPLSTAAADYHAPPDAPREEMWRRIEAAWDMRRSAGPGAREAGLEALPPTPLTDVVEPESSGSERRRSATPWITGIAIAASLVIGIAIGRRSADELVRDPDAATVAQIEPGQTDPDAPTPGALASTQGPDGGGPAVGDSDAGGERLETAVDPATRLVATPVQPAPGETRSGAPGEVGDPVVSPGARRAAVLRYATTEHFGQAEALLTSFRTGGEADDLETSAWARRLLGETRLLMDMPGDRDPRRMELLQELELVLAQIVGLGSDTPAGERALVADGLEQQGTLPRLRAFVPAGSAPDLRVGT
jgi:hypothetical protein